LNRSNVPPSLVFLLPLAETWGIGDDLERAEAVESSSLEELEQMIQAVDDAEDSGLYEWLSGDESYVESPSPEYIAITCLTMAADSARLRLRES